MAYSEIRSKKITAYPHPLNKQMVNAFVLFMQKYFEVGGTIIPNVELGLSATQIANFQKMQHYKLIKKIDKVDGYIPTLFGVEFYNGSLPVVYPAISFDNKVVGVDHPAWETFDKERKILYIGDIVDVTWKRREEYREDKKK